MRAFLTEPAPLIITKSNVRSHVHRRVHMDYVGVKTFDTKGTSDRRAALRRTVHLDRLFHAARRHSAAAPQGRARASRARACRATATTARRWPTSSTPIRATNCSRSARTSFSPPRSAFSIWASGPRCACSCASTASTASSRRSSSCRANATTRPSASASTRILARAFDGRKSAAHPMLDEEALARVHYIVGRNRRPAARSRRPRTRSAKSATPSAPGTTAFADAVAGRIRRSRRPRVCCAVMAAPSRPAIATSSRPAEAVDDIVQHRSGAGRGRARAAPSPRTSTAAPTNAPATVRLKLFVQGRFHSALRLPAGVRKSRAQGDRRGCLRADAAGRDGSSEMIALHSLHMQRADGAPRRSRALKAAPGRRLPRRVGQAAPNSDGFNRLVSRAHMPWRDVSILRAVAKFLRQTGFALSPGLYRNGARQESRTSPAIWSQLFRTLHDPRGFADPRTRARHAAAQLRERIDAALERRAVAPTTTASSARCAPSSRRCCAPISSSATKRRAQALSSPSSSTAASSTCLPAPKPLFEIFVYAPEVEGVHLRFGKVARGGIRWSDRARGFPHRNPRASSRRRT